jgi:hypothetical protein
MIEIKAVSNGTILENTWVLVAGGSPPVVPG